MIALRWVLSLVFVVQMYLAMAVIAVAFAPWALFSRRGARAACKAYCRWVIFTLRLLCGLRSEVRGTPPEGEAMVAAKHQSFLDIILIFNAVPCGKFIMKRELMWAPFLGQYARRIGCIPVNRGKRGAAILKMKADVAAGSADPGQLIIYPQGTRVAPAHRGPTRSAPAFFTNSSTSPATPSPPMSASSGPSAASCADPASPWWSSCPPSRPACPWPIS